MSASGAPISENTFNASLRRLGFAAGGMTGHGFRNMAERRRMMQKWADYPDGLRIGGKVGAHQSRRAQRPEGAGVAYRAIPRLSRR